LGARFGFAGGLRGFQPSCRSSCSWSCATCGAKLPSLRATRHHGTSTITRSAATTARGAPGLPARNAISP
jgi:hypothetical protein